MTDPSPEERLKRLREAFDHSFVQSEQLANPVVEDVLTLRLQGDPYAVRIRELSGLYRDLPVRPVLSPLPSLLGVTGIQNGIVAVHSLSVLLGYPRADTGTKWLALCRRDPGSEWMALSFDVLEGWVQMPSEVLLPYASEERPHVSGIVHEAGASRYVIGLPSLIELLLGKRT